MRLCISGAGGQNPPTSIFRRERRLPEIMRRPPKPSEPKSPWASWTPEVYKLPVLSVRQPSAWLICAGFKEIESRRSRIRYRGPLLIHAGLKVEDAGRQIKQRHGLTVPRALATGGVVGLVDLVNCVAEHSSPWFAGTGYGLVLANPSQLRFRRCAGACSLFHLPNKGAISAEDLSAFDDGILDEDGDFTEETEEELPSEEYDDERDIEERADGYPVDENDDDRVLCACSIHPCIHNNPRPLP